MPGRCAAPPAPAIITSMPRFSAEEAYSNKRSGVRCADTTRISCGTPSSSSVFAACSIVSQSEDEPMMMPTKGDFAEIESFAILAFTEEADILRCFSPRRDLRALFPILAKLPDQVQRASDENGVFGTRLGDKVIERLLGVGDNGTVFGQMRGNLAQLRSRDGARGARLCEHHFSGLWEEQSGDFVDGFVAQRPVKQENFAAAKVLLPEGSQLAGRARVVGAVDVDVRPRLQFFQASRPNGGRNALLDRGLRNPISPCGQRAGRGHGIHRVLQLKTSGQLWGKARRPARGYLCDSCMRATILERSVIQAIGLGRFNNWTPKFRCPRQKNFASFRSLPGEHNRNTLFQDAGFFGGDVAQRMPQKVFVIEIDGRDQRNCRSQNIGGVEPPAQANLKHAKINARLGEILKCHGRYALKVSGMRAKFSCCQQFFD